MIYSVAEWLEYLTFFKSCTPNLKVSGSIPHAITSANLAFHNHVQLTASSKASSSHTMSICCGRLKIPEFDKSVGLGLSNDQLSSNGENKTIQTLP